MGTTDLTAQKRRIYCPAGVIRIQRLALPGALKYAQHSGAHRFRTAQSRGPHLAVRVAFFLPIARTGKYAQRIRVVDLIWAYRLEAL